MATTHVPDVKPFHAVLNNVSSTASGAIDNSTDPVTFSVAAGDGASFPQPTTDGDFFISIDSEILRVITRATDALTCTRAEGGTTIASHLSGAAVELRIIANALTEVQNAATLMLEGWADDTALTVTLGRIPANAFVYAVDIWIQEAFDFGNNDDSIIVGIQGGDTDAYVTTGFDMQVVGLREHVDEGVAGPPGAGVALGTVDATSRVVDATVTGTGGAPTTGRVFITLHYFLATVQPA